MKVVDHLLSDSPMTSEIRKLEALLWHLSRSQHLRVILLASAERAEGKTTTAAYLTTALAMPRNRRILAVDLDFRRPKLSAFLEIDAQRGLADVIRGECELEQAIAKTSLPNLDVLAPGSESEDPGLLVNSTNLGEIFEMLRPAYDLIVVDTPALVPVADASPAIPLSDGVLLVAMAGRTNRHHLRRARELCVRVGANILGLVVNNIQEAAPEYLTASAYEARKHRA